MAPVQFGGHTYELTAAPATWDVAEADAVAMGGQLVAINSAAEQQFINSAFLSAGEASAAYPLWIGLTNGAAATATTPYSTWTTGESVVYTNWFPGEPNDLDGIEHYVAVNWDHIYNSSNPIGTWDDLPDGGSGPNNSGGIANAVGPYYGIVEIVPEPATGWMLGLGGAVGAGLFWSRRMRRAV